MVQGDFTLTLHVHSANLVDLQVQFDQQKKKKKTYKDSQEKNIIHHLNDHYSLKVFLQFYIE